MSRIVKVMLGVVGLVFILGGLGLPPQTVARAVLPASKPEFFGPLVNGIWCLKAALVFNGSLLLGISLLWRWLWFVPEEQNAAPRPFFNHPSPAPWSPSESAVLVGLLLLALVLRLVSSNQSLFGDEIGVQQRYISRGLPVIMTFFAHGSPQHVLYSLIAWFFQKLPLPIEVAYRLPAILFGTASVGLTYALARRIFSRFPAAVVGLLSAGAFYGIIYSQNAKGYSATHFFFLVAVWGLVRVNENWTRTRGWAWFAAGLVGLAFTHLYNVYLCAGLVAALAITATLTYRVDRPALLGVVKRLGFALCFSGGFLFLIYSIQLPQIYELFTQVTDKPEDHLSIDSFRGWLMQLTFWGTAWPAALACAILAAIGLLSLARREPRLFLAALLPVATIFLLVIIKDSWIYPRYLLFALPFFLVLYVEGARAVGTLTRTGRAVAPAVLASLVLYAVPTARVAADYYRVGNQNIREAAHCARSHAGPKGVVIAYGLTRDLVTFYDQEAVVIRDLPALEAMLEQTTSPVFLVYGWRHAWEGRRSEFEWIHRRFEERCHFRGYLMDTTHIDGDMYVLEEIK